jgi:hypothetical protein
MSLPIYKQIDILPDKIDGIHHFLHEQINLKTPIIINLKRLNLDQQRECIGIIENFFMTRGLSYHFPYPVYLVMDHERTISEMPSVRDVKNLPKFFNQKEVKLNVKESYLSQKNHLLQVEISNTDSQKAQTEIQTYSLLHKKIFNLEKENIFYRSLYDKLTKVRKHGS